MSGCGRNLRVNNGKKTGKTRSRRGRLCAVIQLHNSVDEQRKNNGKTTVAGRRRCGRENREISGKTSVGIFAVIQRDNSGNVGRESLERTGEEQAKSSFL